MKIEKIGKVRRYLATHCDSPRAPSLLTPMFGNFILIIWGKKEFHILKVTVVCYNRQLFVNQRRCNYFDVQRSYK